MIPLIQTAGRCCTPLSKVITEPEMIMAAPPKAVRGATGAAVCWRVRCRSSSADPAVPGAATAASDRPGGPGAGDFRPFGGEDDVEQATRALTSKVSKVCG